MGDVLRLACPGMGIQIQMKRTGFKLRDKPMARGASKLKSGTSKIKSSRPKTTPIRASARGEDCTIELAGVCNYDPTTVVWCHENSYAAGKGMGLKALDIFGAYGCSACHAVYDGQVKRPPWLTEEEVDYRFEQAKAKSREKLIKKKLLPLG